nr:MAG TPA: hypothetical protein [Caudoviricetes sp.]
MPGLLVQILAACRYYDSDYSNHYSDSDRRGWISYHYSIYHWI